MARKEKALLLLHGMGNSKPPRKGSNGKLIRGDFGKEFIKATTQSLQRYENHKTDTLEKHIDIHELNYNSFFDKIRKKMADRAKSMKARLDSIAGITGVSFATDLVGRLTSLEADFGDDDFFHTHLLDVIFYSTMLGAKVRVDLGVKVAELVENYGQGNVHVVSHSLGTAVTHDTLHMLYRPESDPNDEIPDLHLTNHKLGSIWMVANVSRLVNAFTRLADPMTSVVKPGDHGCTNDFINIRHKMDPFTWLSQFNPVNNGSWVTENIYNSAYQNIETDLVVKANTHSFSQYMLDPKVAEMLFFKLIPFDATLEEMDAVSRDYSTNSINGAFATLEENFHNLNVKDITSWREFIETGKALRLAAENIKNNL
ncbi:MAG: hypothetical protein QNL62_08810 [Gammaproteobacteria bacterium]|nr:hypothetical protein [Gammaproteobacteria bacterium]